MDEAFLRQAWDRLADNLGIAGEGVFQELSTRYREPHRAYHTLDHIEQCLREFEEVGDAAGQPDHVELALWFHDAVYNPKADDNEARSAELARTLLGPLSVPAEVIQRVGGLVMATTHSAVPTDTDASLLVDVDLSILGASRELFDDYEEGIRREYAWVPEPVFRKKRKEILTSFLKRDSIYSSPAMRARYETRARENVKRAIEKL